MLTPSEIDNIGFSRALKGYNAEEVDDFFKVDNSKELKDIKILQYKNMGPIKFPLAQ